MKVGDKVTYHTARGLDFDATVIAVTGERSCNLSYKRNARTIEAHAVSSTPGLTGECWIAPETKQKKEKTPEQEAKTLSAKAVEITESISAKGDEQAEIEHEDDANADGQPPESKQ